MHASRLALLAAGISDGDLLYVSYEVQVQGMLPYYIALDRARRSLVVSVRGSLSLSDVVTDLMAHPAPLRLPAGGWYCQVRTSHHALGGIGDGCCPCPGHPP